MFAKNQKISLRQMQALLLLQCFGTAVLFLPAELAAESGRGCWIAAIIGAGVWTGACLLLSALGNAGKDAVFLCRTAFGKGIGTAVVFGLIAKLLFDGAYELRIFSEVVCRSMLPHTPVWVIAPVVLILCGLLAAKGIESCGRLAELLFFFAVLPLLLVLAAVAVTAEYQRVLPMAFPDVRGIAAGIGAVGVVFQGLPLLYVLFPYVQKPKRTGHAAVGAAAAVGTVIMIVTLLCLAVFGPVPLSQKLLPTLQMLERVSFSGIFLTRQDVVFLWFWMCTAVVFVAGVLFAVQDMGARLFGKKKRWLWGAALLLWAVSFLPENLTEAYRLRAMVSPWMQLGYGLVLPLVLLFLQRGGEKDV